MVNRRKAVADENLTTVEVMELTDRINDAIVKIRGAYAEWCKRHGISYYEMLVFYSMRGSGVCTQKQICDNYRIPKQSINNIVRDLKAKGYIRLENGENDRREKRIIMTDTGKEYYGRIIQPLNELEAAAVQAMGTEKIREMTELSFLYADTLAGILQNRGEDRGEQYGQQ